MKIVPAEPADFEAVRQITQATIRAVYPRYYPQGAVDFFLAHHNDAAIEKDIREKRVYLCISDDGEPAGTVTVTGSEIGRLFVLPAYQGKGYGKAALTEIIRYFRENGANTITLSTEADNNTALHLYHQFGFKETGAMNDDEIELRLVL